jgi:hypothetical protein
MKRLLVMAVLVVTALGFGSNVALAANKGNNTNAKFCQTYWQTWVGTSGAFASQSACATYGSTGGTYYPAAAPFNTPVPNVVGTFGGANVYFLQLTSPAPKAGPVTTQAVIGWVPNQALTFNFLEQYASGPASFSYPNLCSTGSGGVVNCTGTFFENCIDPTGVRELGTITYTGTVTDAAGQSASFTGSFNCALLPPTLTASTAANGPSSVWINLAGNEFASSVTYTMTFVDPAGTFTFPSPNTTDLAGNLTLNNYIYTDSGDCTAGHTQPWSTTPVAYTVSVTDAAGLTASTSGTIPCNTMTPTN